MSRHVCLFFLSLRSPDIGSNLSDYLRLRSCTHLLVPNYLAEDFCIPCDREVLALAFLEEEWLPRSISAISAIGRLSCTSKVRANERDKKRLDRMFES